MRSGSASPPGTTFGHQVRPGDGLLAVLVVDGQSQLPVVRLVSLRDDVVGRGQRHRTVWPVQQRDVLRVQGQVAHRDRERGQAE